MRLEGRLISSKLRMLSPKVLAFEADLWKSSNWSLKNVSMAFVGVLEGRFSADFVRLGAILGEIPFEALGALEPSLPRQKDETYPP